MLFVHSILYLHPRMTIGMTLRAFHFYFEGQAAFPGVLVILVTRQREAHVSN